MGLLDDIRVAIKNYADEFVRVEISEVNWPGEEGAANVGDTGTFSINVKNDTADYLGHMDLSNLILTVTGTEYADVAYSFPPYGSPSFKNVVTTIPFTIHAHKHVTIPGLFRVQAKKKTSGFQKIFSVKIENFDLNWEHMLKDHTGSTPTKDSCVENILPT